MSDEPNENKATEVGQKPFQFTIRHIIYLTVAVALLCALWNVLDVELSVYFSSILLSLFALAFLYCNYSLPNVLRDTKRKSTIIIGSLMIAYPAFWCIWIFAFATRDVLFWVISLMFPYTTIAVAFLWSSIHNDFFQFVITFLLMFAQTYIYVITFMLAKKRKRALVASAFIGIFHILAVPTAYDFIVNHRF